MEQERRGIRADLASCLFGRDRRRGANEALHSIFFPAQTSRRQCCGWGGSPRSRNFASRCLSSRRATIGQWLIERPGHQTPAAMRRRSHRTELLRYYPQLGVHQIRGGTGIQNRFAASSSSRIGSRRCLHGSLRFAVHLIRAVVSHTIIPWARTPRTRWTQRLASNRGFGLDIRCRAVLSLPVSHAKTSHLTIRDRTPRSRCGAPPVPVTNLIHAFEVGAPDNLVPTVDRAGVTGRRRTKGCVRKINGRRPETRGGCRSWLASRAIAESGATQAAR